MATSNKTNNLVQSTTTLTTIPAPTTQTGTFSVLTGSKDVTGTSTKFLTEVKQGDWLIDYTNFEVRKVESVKTDTALELVSGFSNDQSGIAVKTCPSSRVVRIQLVSAAGGKLNNVTMPTSIPVELDKSSRETMHSPIDYIDPVFVDGTGGAIFTIIQF